MSLASLWMVAVLTTTADVETKFAQVAPAYREDAAIVRSDNEDRAVVLLQGLCLHPFSSSNVDKPRWQRWQKPESGLVQTLAKDSDVYAFAYGQNVGVEKVADSASLAENVKRLKELGYSQIIFVGHSAGGIVARHFVEDHSDAGVTKVIQVCSPNGGSSWGKAELGVCDRQETFLGSLTKQSRECCLAGRCDKKIPDNMEFVCLVGQLELKIGMNTSFELWEGTAVNISAQKQFRGDGIVASECQWTRDLQEQGIPAITLPVNHVQAMRNKAVTDKIAELVRDKQSRLNAEKIAEARRQILGQE